MLNAQSPNAAPSRNEACPCGSGKKFKKCCALLPTAPTKAASVNPAARAQEITRHWQATVRAFENGQLAQAQADCDALLALDPQHADALHVRALLAYRQQELAAALIYVKRALKRAPRAALFHNSLGIILNQASLEATNQPAANQATANQQTREAAAAFREALRLDPACAPAAHNLGDLLEKQGQRAEAKQLYLKALKQQPNFPEALNSLGALFISENQFPEAVQALTAALRLRPNYAKAQYHLARALKALGQRQDALTLLRQAVQLDASLPEAWHDLGVLLKEAGAHADAIASFEQAVARKPEQIESYFNIGNCYYELGLGDQSRAWFARAQAIKPSDALKLRTAFSLPGFYDSQEQLDATRAQFTADLEQLLAENLRIDDPIQEIGLTPFFLAYQGHNDVELLSRVAEVLLKACPALGFRAPHCSETLPDVSGRRVELGFISSYFGREHIVNRSVAGLIASIPRDRFRVTILHLDGPCEEIRQTLQEGDQLVKVPYALPEARARIAAEKLDILFYTDLGLEPWTYFLSFARLAPVQCTCGGHPVTSGVPNVDFYLSSALDEIPEAQAHYRERLVQLPDRPVCYFPAAVPELPRTRADFGLSEERRFYFCPMTPFKLHPATDELFGKLLRADPAGEIVFVINHQRELWERLQARFARTLPDVAARLRYLPHQTMPEFVALLRLADVLLDTPAFNGGTTSFEALAVGTPIVTLPGEFFRQRVTYGMYKWMGMFDCVAQDADDYVRLALEIAQQPARRAALKEKILARNHILFGQVTGIHQEVEFLLNVMQGQA